MNDLTILYYTANRISDVFANNVRAHLLESSGGEFPIISISQKPLAFGQNICVGEIGCSAYNVYKQILIGAMEATTEYVACCEDDTLYNPEHFTYRPFGPAFAYNLGRWSITPAHIFFYRHNRAVMGQCIVPTDLMIRTLAERYARYPTYREQLMKVWGEPGRYEHALGLTPVHRVEFHTEVPTVAFKHYKSLSGVRNRRPGDIIQTTLEPWGEACTLWKRIYQ